MQRTIAECQGRLTKRSLRKACWEMASWASEHPQNFLTSVFCVLPPSTERPQVDSGSVFLGGIWPTLLPPGRTNYTSYSWQKHLSLIESSIPYSWRVFWCCSIFIIQHHFIISLSYFWWLRQEIAQHRTTASPIHRLIASFPFSTAFLRYWGLLWSSCSVFSFRSKQHPVYCTPPTDQRSRKLCNTSYLLHCLPLYTHMFFRVQYLKLDTVLHA